MRTALLLLAAATSITSADPGRWHGLSIEQIAYAIADPGSDHFRDYLTTDEATELLKQIPPIDYALSANSRKRDGAPERGPLPRESEPVIRTRDTCGSGDLVTPSCIRQVYGIDYVPQPSRVTFAVYATEGASYNPADLTSFLKQFRPEASAAAYTVIGSGDPASPAGVEGQFEVALDTQTLLGTAWPAQGILYNLGGVFGPTSGKPYKPLVDFLHGLILNDTAPSVVSFSESMPENRFDVDYARALCLTMALVGARGVSLLFSSGNNGPNGDTPGGEHRAIFEPEFPASCPWVTAVGGTTNLADEMAATASTIPAFDATFYTASGGGFSNIFERPTYQHVLVPEYIANHVPASYYNTSGFNARGRGIPDLSAFSTNMPTTVNGVTLPLGGTSSSTPLWAAVITLLNDHEASQGRPALGFLNPWLYSLNEGIKDIVTGGNNQGGCNALTGCNLTETLGYYVTPSWDPVTGLGSPMYGGLVQALEEAAYDCY